MADPAVTTTVDPIPTTPPAAPALEPTPAVGDVAPAAPPSDAAPTVTQPPAVPGQRPPPSWDDWKNARTRARTEAAARAEAESKLAEERGRRETIEQERAREREELETHRALANIVRAEPSLYQAVMERLEGANIRLPPTGAPGPGGAATPPVATLAPEVTGKLDKALSFFEQLQRERADQQEQAVVSQRIDRLRTLVTQQVRERGLAKTPAVEAAWVQRAVPGVVRMAQQNLEGGGDESDIPWLFERFVATELGFLKAINGEQIAAHTANAAAIAPVPATAPAGAPPAAPLALGTTAFRDRSKQLLRSMLGQA